MDIRALLRALRRSWWIVVLITLLGLGVGIFVTVRTPPTYASAVTFFVKTPTSGTDSALSGDQLDRVLGMASQASFRAVAILPAILLVVFGAIWLYDRSKGGFKAVKM